jgi:hypothetical protein
MDHRMPIVVFNLLEPGNIRKVVLGAPIGTIVRAAPAAESAASAGASSGGSS